MCVCVCVPTMQEDHKQQPQLHSQSPVKECLCDPADPPPSSLVSSFREAGQEVECRKAWTTTHITVNPRIVKGLNCTARLGPV